MENHFKKINRRQFLKGLSGSLALSSLGFGLGFFLPGKSEGFFENEENYLWGIKEKIISKGEPFYVDSKTAMFLHSDEFFNYSDEFRFEREPEKFAAERWNLIMNMVFRKSEESYSTAKKYETNISDSQIDAGLTQEKIKYGRDRIIYSRFQDPRYIFDYLKKFRGLDRLIISAHGSARGISSNSRKIFFSINKILDKYSPDDFKGVISDKGQISLEICNANADYDKELVLGEVFAYLFNSPVTAPLETNWMFSQNLHDYREGKITQKVTFTPYKTVYPSKR